MNQVSYIDALEAVKQANDEMRERVSNICATAVEFALKAMLTENVPPQKISAALGITENVPPKKIAAALDIQDNDDLFGSYFQRFNPSTKEKFAHWLGEQVFSMVCKRWDEHEEAGS